MKKVMFAAFALALLPALALAVSIPVTGSDLSDFRSTPDNNGIYAEGGVPGNLGWSAGNGGFKISWDISYNAVDQDWDYSYTISNATDGALGKDLSHWVLQISDIIPETGFSDYLYDSNIPFEGPDEYGIGGSNPDMPDDIYGIKFGGGAGPLTFSFSSSQIPVWGNFYAKDGTDKPSGQGGSDFMINVTAWNTGLDPANNFILDENTLDFTPWVPTPDTIGGPPQEVVPEPMTVSLLGLGVIGLIARKRRKA